MSRAEKAKMIDELASRLTTLKEKRSIIDNEARELAEQRDKLNAKVKILRTEIQTLRQDRDRANETVRELKQQRSETNAKLKEKAQETRKLKEEVQILEKRKPQKSHRALQREVDDIDWKIQTTPLTLEEDRQMVEEVKHLESQLNIHRKIENMNKRIRDLQIEMHELKTENESCHQMLTANAKNSQEIHTKMLTKIDECNKLRTEADMIHKEFLATKEKARPLQQEIEAIRQEIVKVKEEMRTEEVHEKVRSENALRETIEKKAREKIRRGEKLSWEEFQLLAQKGEMPQD